MRRFIKAGSWGAEKRCAWCYPTWLPVENNTRKRLKPFHMNNKLQRDGTGTLNQQNQDGRVEFSTALLQSCSRTPILSFSTAKPERFATPAQVPTSSTAGRAAAPQQPSPHPHGEVLPSWPFPTLPDVLWRCPSAPAARGDALLAFQPGSAPPHGRHLTTARAMAGCKMGEHTAHRGGGGAALALGAFLIPPPLPFCELGSKQSILLLHSALSSWQDGPAPT